jgi:pyruvate kinase
MISKMLLAGVTCARLDLTWGSLQFHLTSLKNLSAAMKATKRLCSVWVDTVGREIIVRLPAKEDSNGWMVLEKTPIQFEEGREVIITTDPGAQASASLLPVNNPKFPSLVQPGNVLHVGRFLATGAEGGSLFLQVQSTSPKEIRCVAQNNANLVGVLTVLVSHREFELHLHDHDLNRDLPLMSSHDIDCLRTFGADFEIDFLTLSYSNSAEDVWSARQTLDAMGLTQTKIMAKVERKAAIHNFDEIVAAADGILLSRGNLGLDFEPEEMALLQKHCVGKCNSVGKPIVLTRFVDTMVNTPRPTRAEATDVANAVLDGVDGVLLGAETLRGLYPVDTVKTVIKLCRSAEKYFDYRLHHEDMMGEAFDEELSLDRAHPSSADLSMKEAPHPPPLNRISTVRPPAAAGGANGADALEAMGSPGGAMHGDGTTVTEKALTSDRRASSFGVLPHRVNSEEALEKVKVSGAPLMSKVESIASSAVRTAEKINAGLILVLAQTGRTVSLVAKYRPPMPILAVVVPTLRSSNLGWQMEGKFLARQCLVMRGVRPMLAAPMAGGSEGLLGEAIACAHGQGLVKPRQYVVCILNQKQSLVVKVVQVNERGDGIAKVKLGPENELDGIVAAAAAGAAAAQQEAAGVFGTPPSPSYMRRTSMSLKGAGTFSGENSSLVADK